jgi:peptidoglycan hydrolase CwlO-like protein
MMKKTIYVGAAAALLLGLLFGRDAVSYVSTSVSRIHQTVKDSVPIEFELERARNMIKDITPEIRRSMHLIAKEEVKVEQLASQIGNLEGQLAKDEENILNRKADLQTGESYYYYAGHRYSRDAVNDDLGKRFNRFKTQDENLGALHKMLGARQQGLEAARTKLNDMMAAKKQLEVEVENLEARLKMIEVAKTTADFHFDDSHLARTKELISEINIRVKTEEKLLGHLSDYEFEIPVEVDEPEVKDVTDEITDYFGGTRPDHSLVNISD